MKMHEEGYRALAIAITSLLISGYEYITTVYSFNIRYIMGCINRTITLGRIWYHSFFVANVHVNLLYLDAPFSTAISYFWMGL